MSVLGTHTGRAQDVPQAATQHFTPAGLHVRRARLAPGRHARTFVGQEVAAFPQGAPSFASQVLLVDDDPMCLNVVSAMLRRCNYEGAGLPLGRHPRSMTRCSHC